MSHIDRRQREKEETRLKILEAAREIAAKEGWQAVTIRKIADKVEYTPPIVYEYFENKEDLLKGLVYFGFEMLHKPFEEARKTESDPKKLMTKLALIHLDFAMEHKELFQLMFSLERPTPNESMQESMKQIAKSFQQISKADREELRELIFGFLCMCHGAISFMLQAPKTGSRIGPKDFRQLYTRMIERYLNSL